jgi:nucleoside-diphosphate-sugar epimerase
MLVLGGNGFIGSPIVDVLLLPGHEVSILHRSVTHSIKDDLANFLMHLA